MSTDRGEVTATLKESPLFDRGLLKPGGRVELLAAIERWKASGLRAFIVITERNEELAPLRSLFADLSLDSKKDLLLLFNGTRWEARGWGLGEARIAEVLHQSESGLHSYYARGLILAIDGLGVAATGLLAPSNVPAPATARPTTDGTGSGVWTLTGIGLVGAGALAWVVKRRQQMGRARLAEFQKHRLAAEQVYADVMLAAEELADGGVEEKRRASELKRRLDSLERQASHKPLVADDPVMLGRARQLQNEMTTIYSTILQKRTRS